MTERRPGDTWIAAAALALLLLLVFWPVASGARAFFHMDLFYEHVPVWEATQRSLAAGDSPFWLDGEWCGHPVLFHQEAPLFYPLTVPLLATATPAFRLADLFSLFHFWLAGFAAFFFLRDVTSDGRAALFGGVAWMLSTRMVQGALWPNAVAVGAYLPLVLWGIVRIGRGERRSGVLIAAISGGLALLLARPHVLLAALPVVAAVAVWAVCAAGRSRLRAVTDLVLAAALALLLGAPSLAPSVALYSETSRAAGLSKSERDFRPADGSSAVQRAFLPLATPPPWPENAAYPGVVVAGLFLAGLVLAARRNEGFPRGLFLALAAGGLVGLVCAAGERGPYGLIADWPLLRGFRVPSRFLTSWGLALALGAALALAALCRSRTGRRLIWLAVVAAAADLGLHARRSAPTAPASVWAIEPDLAAGLGARLGRDEAGFPRRYLSKGMTLFPFFYLGDSLRVAIQHFDPLKGGSAMRFGLESVSGAGPSLARTEVLFEDPTLRAIELGGVGAIVSNAPRPEGAPTTDPPPLRVESFEGLPRAILVPEVVVVPPERAIAVIQSAQIDPRRTAVLEDGEPLAFDARWDPSAASVTAAAYRPGRIELDARLPSAGVLVVFNSFESGWRATVDGAPAPVERADAAFQGVRLPPGTHRIELTYHPPGLTEGLAIGLAGVLATILAALRLREAV